MTNIGAPNPLDVHYITLRGVSSLSSSTAGQQITVMAGDEKPTITAGYAKWSVVDRPLNTGVTTLQGYDPVSMDVSVRFGVWNGTNIVLNIPADPYTPASVLTDNPRHQDTNLARQAVLSGSSGWDVSPAAGEQVEQAITVLEWMAGASQQAGPPPFVYANSYDAHGLTSDLIPRGYQSSGKDGAISNPTQWPWVIDGGIQWGQSWSIADYNPGYTSAQRVYQEAKFTLRNFQGFTATPQVSKPGVYFKSSSGRDTCNKIANAPSVVALDPAKLAQSIRTSPKNNPIRGTHYELQRKSLSSTIPHGYQVWVPQHIL